MISIVQAKDHRVISSLNEEVQNLHAELHPELFKRFDKAAMDKAMAGFFEDPNCLCFLAMKEEQPIGYLLCMLKEAKENAFHYTIRTLYIDQVAVLKAHQESGAGRLLMEYAEKIAKENNVQKIELDHWSANHVAAAFFRRRGYQLCKERLFKATG